MKLSKKQHLQIFSIITILLASIFGLNLNKTDQITSSELSEVVVTKVIDGDTIELDTGEKLRYIGIDTPETKHPNKKIECFGEEASLINEELLLGKTVTLEKDVSETDRYGRLLRYVYVNELMVNEYLVRHGFAQAVSFPPDVKYQERFKEAERLAREENLGLWGNCVIESE
jgi:micrococcal nuclease